LITTTVGSFIGVIFSNSTHYGLMYNYCQYSAYIRYQLNS
jgi:hypothetical protein